MSLCYLLSQILSRSFKTAPTLAIQLKQNRMRIAVVLVADLYSFLRETDNEILYLGIVNLVHVRYRVVTA